MRVLNVLQAVSIRAIRFIGNNSAGPTSIETIQAIAERYHFVKFPTTSTELIIDDPNVSYTFRMGMYESAGRTIPIDMFQIFRSALAVTTHTNTNDSDSIITDGLEWAVSSLKAEYEPIRPGFAHRSELEFRLERPLPDMFPQLRGVSDEIGNGLGEFWEPKPRYELTTLNFWFDRSKFPAIAPSNFSIERRAETPFEQNVYFSTAPLSTDKHIAALSMFEHACS